MNSIQNAQLASYKLMVTEAENNAPKVALIPVFQNKITRLKEIVAEIDGLAVEQSKNLSGITEDKNDNLEELSHSVIDVAGALHSYATGIGDKVLLAKVNYKSHKVGNMKQADLMNAAGVVLEEAGKLPAEALAEEGITAEEMTQFAAVYALFKGSVSGKREAVIDRTGHTARISELFAEAADLKKNSLDRLASQFMRKAPEFYNKYKAASVVIHKHRAKKDAPVEGKV